MDYEIKYKELVEAARAVVEGNPGLCNINKRLGRLRDLLPEKESEDERIRKFLVDILSHGTWRKEWPFGPNEVVAYLEKQKEQKPAECIEDSVKFKEGFKAGRESGLCDGQKYVLNNLDSYGLCESAEWSEEDNDIINEVASILINDENRADNKGEEDRLAYLAERIQSLCPQPKQEWSEEDEKMFDQLKEILNIVDAELCKKLNGETILIGEAEFNYLKFGIAHCLSWLELRIKSLRPQPHWKPSEEQMRAVFDASERNDKLGSILINLYNELKKL